MKILKVLFVVVFILYIIGFFAIAPLKMLAVDTRSAPVMLVANEAY
ncbi:hypothetical protein [Hahella sp. CCB-MM4]|nr:hypothetical protein [Hahella sp. CCB-MM4]